MIKKHGLEPGYVARAINPAEKTALERIRHEHVAWPHRHICNGAHGHSIASPPVVSAQTADTILLNGKIITVDERFTIAQALAIRGERIVAVGKNADVRSTRGRDTQVIDLKTRTVIPGLIDNHAHFIRAPEHDELRLDGVTSRAQALAMLAERVRGAQPGEWIATLGGWSEDQFTDEPRGFPLEELDRIAPDNPVVLQAVYIRSYLNSAALKRGRDRRGTPDPRGGAIEKDAGGRPTGVVSGAGGVAFVAAQDPAARQGAMARQRAQVRRRAERDGHHRLVRRRRARHERGTTSRTGILAERGELNARAFWTTIRQPATPEQVDKVLAEIQQLRRSRAATTSTTSAGANRSIAPATTQLLRND